MSNTPALNGTPSQSVTDQVKTIVAFVIEREPAELEATASLPEDYDVTSLLGLEILVALQKAFKIKIPETVMDEMTTIHAISLMVEQYVADQRP